jgi:myosin tail region-interacting protein MTI1
MASAPEVTTQNPSEAANAVAEAVPTEASQVKAEPIPAKAPAPAETQPEEESVDVLNELAPTETALADVDTKVTHDAPDEVEDVAAKHLTLREDHTTEPAVEDALKAETREHDEAVSLKHLPPAGGDPTISAPHTINKSPVIPVTDEELASRAAVASDSVPAETILSEPEHNAEKSAAKAPEPSVSTASPDPEEEDEAERRARIAARLAKMGGVNPFAARSPVVSPPASRKASVDPTTAGLTETSPPPPPRRMSTKEGLTQQDEEEMKTDGN